MAASAIYGVACNYMPILGFFVLNRTFHFHIPLFDIQYKPWRFYLLFCGLPSLVCAIVLLFLPESPKYTFSKVWASCLCGFSLDIQKHSRFPFVAGQRAGNLEYFKANLQNQQPEKWNRLQRHESRWRSGIYWKRHQGNLQRFEKSICDAVEADMPHVLEEERGKDCPYLSNAGECIGRMVVKRVRKWWHKAIQWKLSKFVTPGKLKVAKKNSFKFSFFKLKFIELRLSNWWIFWIFKLLLS